MTLSRPGARAATALLSLAAAFLPAAPARAEESLPPRYELLFSPTLDAESGVRLVSSAVTGTGAGEEPLVPPPGAGAGAAASGGAGAERPEQALLPGAGAGHGGRDQ